MGGRCSFPSIRRQGEPWPHGGELVRSVHLAGCQAMHGLESLNVPVARIQPHPLLANHGPSHPLHGLRAIHGRTLSPALPAHHAPADARLGPHGVGVLIHGTRVGRGVTHATPGRVVASLRDQPLSEVDREPRVRRVVELDWRNAGRHHEDHATRGGLPGCELITTAIEVRAFVHRIEVG
jgi:hypothetical protein